MRTLDQKRHAEALATIQGWPRDKELLSELESLPAKILINRLPATCLYLNKENEKRMKVYQSLSSWLLSSESGVAWPANLSGDLNQRFTDTKCTAREMRHATEEALRYAQCLKIWAQVLMKEQLKEQSRQEAAALREAGQ